MATVYLTATTLDGFIADEHDSLEWLFTVETGEDAGSRWSAFLDSVGVMAMGATTYAWMLRHDDFVRHPERWREAYGERPLWVFTHRDLPAVPGIDMHLVQGDVAPPHADMVAAAGGKDVWLVGGGELVGMFHDVGLLDEIRAQVAPVTLGGGAPLLPRRIEGLQVHEVHRNGQFVEITYRV